MITHLYPKLSRIRALIVDCDGVMTNGQLIYTRDGDDLHTFYVRDGLGLVGLRQAGLFIGMITGRASASVRRRVEDLRFHAYYEAIENKEIALRELCMTHHLSLETICYIGDDINDIPAAKIVGLSVAVADSEPELLATVDWVTHHRGGCGAVREVCNAIAHAQNIILHPSLAI